MNTCRFSPCRRYRYTLEHAMDELQIGKRKQVMWIGLNPSTADESSLDPTLRRIRGFTMREGGTVFVMTNLFAWRDTDPKKMKVAADPIGPENDALLVETAAASDVIVCAWGTHGGFRDRARAVVERLRQHHVLMCLGWNADGSPLHPLYVPGMTPLQLYHPPCP